jgi:hypothetical protein
MLQFVYLNLEPILSLKQTRDKLGGMKAAGRNLNTAAITNIQ